MWSFATFVTAFPSSRPPCQGYTLRHMSHSSGRASSHMRQASQHRSSSARPHGEANGDADTGTEKFPDFDHAAINGRLSSPHRSIGQMDGPSPARWQGRRDSRVRWAANGQTPHNHNPGHGRRSSISQAIRHMRSASMSQNAQEVAAALRAPVSWKLIVCVNPPKHKPIDTAWQKRGS